MDVSEIVRASEWLPTDQMTKFLAASANYSWAGVVPEEPEPGEDTSWYALFLAYREASGNHEETKEERQKRLRSERNHRYYVKHKGGRGDV